MELQMKRIEIQTSSVGQTVSVLLVRSEVTIASNAILASLYAKMSELLRVKFLAQNIIKDPTILDSVILNFLLQPYHPAIKLCKAMQSSQRFSWELLPLFGVNADYGLH